MQSGRSLYSLGDLHPQTCDVPGFQALFEQIWGGKQRPAMDHFNVSCRVGVGVGVQSDIICL